MDEESIERISCVFNIGRGCAVVGEVNPLIETGAVVGEKFQPIQPVAGQTHREDVFKAAKAIVVDLFGNGRCVHIPSRNQLSNQRVLQGYYFIRISILVSPVERSNCLFDYINEIRFVNDVA